MLKFRVPHGQGRAGLLLAGLAGLVPATMVQAADFTVTNGTTDTAVKTLTAGETGTIDAGGTLSTTAQAVTASGTGVTLINNGTLSVDAGFSVHLVTSSGTNVTLTNNGTASTSGQSIFYSNGANSTLTNNGTMSAAGNLGSGLFSTAADTTLTNTGTITTPGTYGRGLRANGDRNTLTNSGTLTTGAYGIYYYTGTDATIDNSGTITSTGASRSGIHSSGVNTTITHSGAITVSGSGSTGINTTGTASTITVSGSITATGLATHAITGGTGNETLNIEPGARIVGSIDLGTGTNVVNMSIGSIDSGGPSSTLTFTNATTVNTTVTGDSLVVQGGSTVAIVDPTNLATSGVSLGATTVGIHRAVSQQLARSNQPQAVQVASSDLEPGMLYQAQLPFSWGQVFGGRKQRGDDGDALAYQNYVYGAIGGYEKSIDEHSVGVFSGVSRSTLKTDEASIETTSNSFFVGGYGEYVYGDWAMDGTLVAGYQRHDSQRLVSDNVTGEETAQSNYSSVYLSPSLALIHSIDLGEGLMLRPSAELSYTYGYYPQYTETGTTASNLTVEGRGVDVVNSRLQLAARQRLAGGRGELELRAGATYTYYGRDGADISLSGGPPVHHQGTGATSSRGGYVGANSRYDMSGQMTLVVDAEYSMASKNEKTIIGSLGLEYRF